MSIRWQPGYTGQRLALRLGLGFAVSIAGSILLATTALAQVQITGSLGTPSPTYGPVGTVVRLPANEMGFSAASASIVFVRQDQTGGIVNARYTEDPSIPGTYPSGYFTFTVPSVLTCPPAAQCSTTSLAVTPAVYSLGVYGVQTNLVNFIVTPQTSTYLLTITKAGTGSGTVAVSNASLQPNPTVDGGFIGTCGDSTRPFPCAYRVPVGSRLVFSAFPSAGSSFVSWSVNCQPSSPPAGALASSLCSLTLSANTTVSATFMAIKYNLSVTKGGNGSGLVYSSPGGISCGTDCNEYYSNGTLVTLVARPDAGSVASWPNCPRSGTAPNVCAVAMNSNQNQYSEFTQVSSLGVRKVGDGQGKVVSSPSGIDCGIACNKVFPVNSTVQLTATVSLGSVFVGWDNCTVAAGGNPMICNVPIGALPKVVTAKFAKVGTLTLQRVGASGALTMVFPSGRAICGITALGPCPDSAFKVADDTVTPKKLSFTCPNSPCSQSFMNGTLVTVQASPSPSTGFGTENNEFAFWSGTCGGRGACAVNVGNLKVIGVFLPSATLTITKSGDGSGTVTVEQLNARTPVQPVTCGSTDRPFPCTLKVQHNTALRLTSKAADGSRQTWWASCNSFNRDTCIVIMNRSRDVAVSFVQTKTLTLNIPAGTFGRVLVTTLYENQWCTTFPCQVPLLNGTVAIILSAVPGAGTVPGSWAGCDADTGGSNRDVCVVQLSSDKSVTLPFSPIPTP